LTNQASPGWHADRTLFLRAHNRFASSRHEQLLDAT
jgi:hypothetical protein